MKLLDLFSGIGGFSLGLERAGFETIAFCEIEDYPRKVLAKHWPDVPIAGDIRKLSYNRSTQELIYDGQIIYRGAIDAICGGFPCQDLSGAGHGKGINAERSGLYSEMLRIIGESGPGYAIFENVTDLLSGESGRWFAQFLYDLASIGYDAEWHCIPASEFGAPHHRDRVWIIAYPNSTNGKGINFQKPLCTYTEESRRRKLARTINAFISADDYIKWRENNDDVPREMARLKALGNSVYPQIPELLGRAIMNYEESK